jgi:hypothetical protein
MFFGEKGGRIYFWIENQSVPIFPNPSSFNLRRLQPARRCFRPIQGSINA